MIKMIIPDSVRKSFERLNIEDSLFMYDEDDPRYNDYKKLLNEKEIDCHDAMDLATALQSEVEWLQGCEDEEEEEEEYDDEWSKHIENVRQFASNLMTLSFVEMTRTKSEM